MNRIYILILSIFFIFCKVSCEVDTPSLKNPDGITRYGCGKPASPLLALLIENRKVTSIDPKIKIRAPENLGNLIVEIQTHNINLEAGKTSSAISIKLEKGLYSISNAEKKVLFINTAFDFNESIIDGLIIKQGSKIVKDKCYLFGGIEGVIS